MTEAKFQYDEATKKRRENTPIPVTILLLAVFSTALGAIGLLWGAYEQIEAAPEPSSVNELLDEVRQDLPAEHKEMLDAMRQNPELEKQLSDLMENVMNIVPDSIYYTVSGLLLSLVSLIAGIGLFKRKEWGRQLFIWFLVVATAMAIHFFYVIMPGIQNTLMAFQSELALMMDIDALVKSLKTMWIIFSLTLVLLHAGLIYHLTRKKTKEVFVS